MVVGAWFAGLAPAVVWARAWLGPTHPSVVHRAFAGSKTGTGALARCTWVFGSRAVGGEVVAPLNVRALEVLAVCNCILTECPSALNLPGTPLCVSCRVLSMGEGG